MQNQRVAALLNRIDDLLEIHGAITARRGWVGPGSIWNTLPLAELRRRLARKRRQQA
jgi:hypothetical protein